MTKADGSRLTEHAVTQGTSVWLVGQNQVAQDLHRFMAEFAFAQFLHKPESCTEFAQVFLPTVANNCHFSIEKSEFYGYPSGQ